MIPVIRGLLRPTPRETDLLGHLPPGTMRVGGRVDGAVVADRVLIDRNADVTGAVQGNVIVVAGRVRGDVVSAQLVIRVAGARVGGRVRAPEVLSVAGEELAGLCERISIDVREGTSEVGLSLARCTSSGATARPVDHGPAVARCDAPDGSMVVRERTVVDRGAVSRWPAFLSSH